MRTWLAVLALPALMAAAAVGPADDTTDDFKRERKAKRAESNAAKDALEGKAPPALQVEGWMNLPEGSEALDWSQLKGKVVVIDFWGTW